MEEINPTPMDTIYTVGHSNHTSEKFIALLKQHTIACLVDVRSQPYSRYNPHFNRETLAAALQAAGIQYVDMGASLGGRPAQKDLYDPGEERPNYQRQRQTAQYQAGITALAKQAQQATTAIMCSEGNPHECHRGEWLITPDLHKTGFSVQHILPDGTVELAEDLFEQLTFGF